MNRYLIIFVSIFFLWITFSCSQRAYMNMPIPFATFDTCKQVALGGSVATNFAELHGSYAINNRWMVHGNYLSSLAYHYGFSGLNTGNLTGSSTAWELGFGVREKCGNNIGAISLFFGQGFSNYETEFREKGFYLNKYLMSNRQNNYGVCAQITHRFDKRFSGTLFCKPTLIDFQYFSFDNYSLEKKTGELLNENSSFHLNETHLIHFIGHIGARLNVRLIYGLLYFYGDLTFPLQFKYIEKRLQYDIPRYFFPPYYLSIGLHVVFPKGRKNKLEPGSQL